MRKIGYIFNPFTDPTITIDPSRNIFDIELPRKFEKCTLTFNNEIDIVKYVVGFSTINQQIKSSRLINKIVDQKLKAIQIENLTIDDVHFLKVKSATDIRIKIRFDTNVTFKIIAVSIDGKTKDINVFFKENLFSKNKKLNKNRYIRVFVSNLLLHYNDFISNIILTFGAIYLIPLTFELIMQFYHYCRAKKMGSRLKSKYILSKVEEINNAEMAVVENYSRKESWYKFLQLSGPAIGFAITISSLIAGLHPSLQEKQNIAIFFQTIQVAMVSTLLGLLVRIMSILLQKINDKQLIQADEILFNAKEGLTK